MGVWRLWGVVGLLGGALVIGAACEAGGGSSFGAGAEGSGAGSSVGGGGIGGGLGIGGGVQGCSGALTCSPSLHEVICEADGSVVAVCPDGQGCGNGACVAACDAAEINKSTVGCEYFAVNPDVTWSQGACYGVFVANTWTTPVELTVEFDGQALDVAQFARIPSGSGSALTYAPLPNGELPPGEVAILFLAQFGPEALYTPACPAGITPGVSTEDAALHATGIGRSFFIRATAPVAAYDIFPYGGGWSAITSATLLVPTTAWDTNYVGVAPYSTPVAFPPGPNSFSWLQIVAEQDATDVTISPSVAIEGGTGVAATGAGQPITYSINRGDVLQITQAQELSGSPIQANKPIGVIGGNRCMNIPDGSSACDAGHQMLTPVKAMGNEYVGVRHRDRYVGNTESPPWRMVGAVDGTTLSYEPAAPPGAPTTLATGQVVEFSTSEPFVVRSQDADHPFYMSGHMTGCGNVSGGALDCRGDPETVNVVPTSQYLPEYVFFTDPTYPETHLVFVRKRGPNGFEDVELDCLGTVTGWQPLGADYEWTRLDLVTGNFEPVGSCDNGRHEASSAAPFTITVWGWGSGVTGGSIDPNQGVAGFYSEFVSYAYPAGAGVAPVTQIEVPPTPQ